MSKKNKTKTKTKSNDIQNDRDEFQELISRQRIVDFSDLARHFKIKTRLGIYTDTVNYLTAGLDDKTGQNNIEHVLHASSEFYTKLILESYHKWSGEEGASKAYTPGVERSQKVFFVEDVIIPKCKIPLDFCGNLLTRPGVDPFYIVGIVLTDESKTTRDVKSHEVVWKQLTSNVPEKVGKINKKITGLLKSNKSLFTRLGRKKDSDKPSTAEPLKYFDEYQLLIKNNRIIDFTESAREYNIKTRLAVYHDTHLFITQGVSEEVAADNLDKILTESAEAYSKLMLDSYHKWYKNKGDTVSYTPGFERFQKNFHVQGLNLPNGKIEFNFCGNLLTRPDDESFYIIGKIPKGKLKAMKIESGTEIIWKK